MKNYPPYLPCDVPKTARVIFKHHYDTLTQGTNHAFLFSADQKLEHLHSDFWGQSIDPDDAYPNHLFDIASHARIGALATHLGLIAQWGCRYPTVPYIIKLNGKTNLNHYEPQSNLLWDVRDVVHVTRITSLNIIGIGITIYFGSAHESEMLAQAAEQIRHAHEHGLLAIIWAYARGHAVLNEFDGLLSAGLTGAAASLGADFVKIHPPQSDVHGSRHEWLTRAVHAAGRTKVLCSGGQQRPANLLLQEAYNDIHLGGIAGYALGRNIHQRSILDAQALCSALASVIYDDASIADATKLLKQ